MATKGAQNIGLGIFIVAGLVLLIGFIYYIGANQNLFGSTIQVRTVFHNISGLQPGANVRFSGINVGTVETVQITSDTTVELGLRLQNSVVPYVKKDSRSTIGSDGIMGDKVMNISAGTVGAQSVDGGDLLASSEPLELDAIIAKGAEMAQSVNTITANMADITNSIKTGRGTIGMLLYDQKAADRMRFLLTGLNKTVGSLNKNLVNAEQGTEAFSENMKALQGNFLLKGYFKKKEKAKEKAKEEAEKLQGKRLEATTDSLKQAKRSERKAAKIERRKERRLARQGKTPDTSKQQAMDKPADTPTVQ